MLGRCRRIGAIAALVAFTSGILLPGSFVLHEPDDMDAAWGAPGLVAGHAVTQVEPVQPPVEEEHCAICHWMRALTHSVTTASQPGPDIQHVGLTGPPSPVFIQSGVSSPSPARAPPTL